MNKEFKNFRDIDPLDICDVLAKIEGSFNIKLDNEGLIKATTFRSLCDLIVSKIQLEHEDSCTTQHAFYLLRNAIATATGTNKCSITPHTRLSNLFPRENRLQVIQEIELELGFDIDLLQPKLLTLAIFSAIFVGSLIGCYFNWEIGIAGILASILGLKLAGKFGKEMHLKTVGDLASKISRESYLKSRRNSTINKNEIEQKVRELFANDLGLQPILIRRES